MARARTHATTLRALAALLAYPDEEQREALPEVAQALDAERRLDARRRSELLALVDELARGDLLDTQAHYVELFDRGRATSLNLFEHVHGDGGQRGPAMLELMQRYQRVGLQLRSAELPDHLPVVLEYLSCCEPAEAPRLLGECAHVLRALGEALAQRGSRYAAVPAALLALAGQPALAVALTPAPLPEDPDRDWEERPAFEPPASRPPGVSVHRVKQAAQ
ncbi:MAG: nitrate reductase molybdenum cofactor assembly chaperone [Burkholderiales bacterium]|nr:nitrate reductase molybdenum cofactor assembly chaperone [Burkholderiales bacterium]